MLISLGPSAGTEVPASTGGAVGVGVAGLTHSSDGLSLTSARSPGPIVSTVVVATSVPTSAAPISAPNSVAPVSAPADLSQVSSLIAPCGEISSVPAQGMAAVPSHLPSAVLMTVSDAIPAVSIGPETSLGTVSGILPVSAAPYVILGVSAGAGQQPVTAAVPTAVRKSLFDHLHALEQAKILLQYFPANLDYLVLFAVRWYPWL